MASRYDFYEASTVEDEDGMAFPNPFSVNMNKGSLESFPTEHLVNTSDIEKWWLTVYKQYGSVDYKDILLTLNGVPYQGLLDEGETILFPSAEDLKNYMTLCKQNAEKI